MSLRQPNLQNIYSVTSTAVSTENKPFTIPMQDVSSLVVKVYSAGMDASATCDIKIQTTDDGGTTWYDCGAFAQLTTSAITAANALWMVVPIDGTAAVSNGYTGAANAASASTVTGLPILGKYNRILFTYGTATTNSGITVNVYATTQSLNQLRDTLYTVASFTETGVADKTNTFVIPADATSLTFKLYTAGTVLNAGSMDSAIQTTDDGGTTWYSCGRFAQITTNAITSAAALWMTIPIHGTSAVSNGYTGACPDSAYGSPGTASRVTGLPIMDKLVRIKLDYATAASNGGIYIKCYSNTQRAPQSS